MNETQNLRFSVFGPMRGWHGSRELTLGGPRVRAVLAILLLGKGRVYPVEELIDGVWGADVPDSAVSSLRTFVWRLRAAIGEPETGRKALIWDGGYALRLPSDTIVDAFEFDRLTRAARNTSSPTRGSEQLRQALELMNGPVLTGVAGPAARRQRLVWTERRLATLEEKLRLDLDCGRHTQITGQLLALSEAHPLREELQSLLMLALYRAGRQAEALAVYERIRRRLSQQYGLDPTAGLRRTHRLILRSDPELDHRQALKPEPVSS